MSRILVIDDEKNIRNMVRLALEKAGHQVETADTGLSGLLRFGEGDGWDLVLIDQRMPGGEGRQVIPELIRRDPGARVVMMSAFATVELAAEVIQAGVKDFLRKPFTTEILRSAVDKALSRPKTQLHHEHEENQTSAAEPLITYFVNGFQYWSITDESIWPAGIEIGRAFLVRNSTMESARCVVGITPHVREQIKLDIDKDFPENSSLWTTVCGLGLSNFLWQKAQLPPPVLPIFELTMGQLRTIKIIAGIEPFLEF